MIQILYNHTHCQASPANVQTQPCQRVCLSNRTTKTTDKPAGEKEHRSDNKRLAPFFCRRRNTEKRRQASAVKLSKNPSSFPH